MNRKCTNNIKYSDNMVVFEDCLEELKEILVRVVGDRQRYYGLSVNTKKTKYMIICRNKI